MKDYKEKKIYDISITGKFSRYMDRREFHDHLSRIGDRHGIRYYRPDSRVNSHEEYARRLNRCWTSMAGLQFPDRVHYNNHFIGVSFPKTFEIPACNCCLINRKFGDADILGFKDEENCIIFEKSNEFVKKLKYYLDDKELLMKITKSGHDMVHKNHTVEKHISQLVNKLKGVL
jgi:spore maturation protein CgeB